MKYEDKLYFYLALFIFGVAIFDFGAKNIAYLELALYDYTSDLHMLYTLIFTSGLCIGTYFILTLYFEVEQFSIKHLGWKPQGYRSDGKMKRFINFLKKLWKNKRAVGGKAIVTMSIALLLVAYLFPIALLAIADANTTGWATVVATVFQTVLPIIAVIAVALKFMGKI